MLIEEAEWHREIPVSPHPSIPNFSVRVPFTLITRNAIEVLERRKRGIVSVTRKFTAHELARSNGATS